jgi:hypothetical protein
MSEATQLTREQLLARESAFWRIYYKAFEGATIVKFVGIVDDDPTAQGGFPTFEIKYADGSIGKMEVSKDPEGNGGGFLFGGHYGVIEKDFK